MNFTDKLRQMHGEATPGPWWDERVNLPTTEDITSLSVTSWHAEIAYLSSKLSDRFEQEVMSNAQLICLLRNKVPELLELLRAVEGLSTGTDWNNGTHAEIYRPLLLDAMRKLNQADSRSEAGEP